MIYISASGIKDYLVCEARTKYKFQLPRDAILVETVEASIGKLVHRVIELEWANREKGLSLARNLLDDYHLEDKDYEAITRNLEVFYTHFSHICAKGDKIEYKFKYEYLKDVYIVGKMDRIVGEGSSIIDWKTSKTVPFSINNDIQFLMYYQAYKDIFKRPPANVYYAALKDGSLKILKPNINFLETIYYEIIPRMIKDIKNGTYTHSGLFTFNACPRCPYILYCERQKNVMAGRELHNK